MKPSTKSRSTNEQCLTNLLLIMVQTVTYFVRIAITGSKRQTLMESSFPSRWLHGEWVFCGWANGYEQFNCFTCPAFKIADLCRPIVQSIRENSNTYRSCEIFSIPLTVVWVMAGYLKVQSVCRLIQWQPLSWRHVIHDSGCFFWIPYPGEKGLILIRDEAFRVRSLTFLEDFWQQHAQWHPSCVEVVLSYGWHNTLMHSLLL